jgi:hypothetical protein
MTDLSDLDFPKPPKFSEEELERCKATGQYEPVLFEWYKFVGSLVTIVSNIQYESPAFQGIPRQHFHVLIGLLNRCARLMLANVALSHEGRFGETTAIIDRCIFETAIKTIWLCTDRTDDKFTRYLADGLGSELALKGEIARNIVARSGRELKIETRMLASIARTLAAAGLDEARVQEIPRLPPLDQMVAAIGLEPSFYIAIQRMGSHHVHGTWPSLLFHYLEETHDHQFIARDHNSPTHVNQYLSVPLIVLQAMTAYNSYAFKEQEANAFNQLIESVEKELWQLHSEVARDDFTETKTGASI